jgi:hypothetical protein
MGAHQQTFEKRSIVIARGLLDRMPVGAAKQGVFHGQDEPVTSSVDDELSIAMNTPQAPTEKASYQALAAERKFGLYDLSFELRNTRTAPLRRVLTGLQHDFPVERWSFSQISQGPYDGRDVESRTSIGRIEPLLEDFELFRRDVLDSSMQAGQEHPLHQGFIFHVLFSQNGHFTAGQTA